MADLGFCFDPAAIAPLTYGDSVESAISFIVRGWTPVVVKKGGKAPQGANGGGWLIAGLEDHDRLEEMFRGRNVGVRLGPESGHLVDADLDWPEAVIAGRYLLPKTSAIFGRASAPESHRLYQLTARYGQVGVINFPAPKPDPDRKSNIVELRLGAGGKLTQTVFPGSIHETGEAIRWESGCDGEPAYIDGADLEAMCGHTAAAALLARYWPPAHHRHDLRMAVGGMLYKSGFNLPYAKLFAEAVAAAVTCSPGAAAEDVKDFKAAVESSYKSGEEGKPFTAMQRVGEILGDEIGRALRGFMRYGEDDAGGMFDGARAAFEQGGERFDAVTGEFIGRGVETQRSERSPVEAPPLITPTPFVWRDPATIPRRDFLYGTSLIRGFMSCLIAPGASGKSGLTMAEVVAMVTGRELLGVMPSSYLRVWYVNLEDPYEEIERRFHGIYQHYGIGPKDLGGRLFADSGRDQKLVIAKEIKGDAHVVQPVFDRVIQQVKELRLDVIIVDPFIRSHQVSENDNNAIDLVATAWAEIAHEGGCAVGLVHHARKIAAGHEVTIEHARGASSLSSAARSGRVINPMSEAESVNAQVPDHRRHYFRVGDDKANMAPPAEKSDWYRQISVRLPNGDNVGVVTTWKWPNPLDGVKVSDLRAAQAEVAAGSWRKDSQASDWVGIAIAKALDLDVEDPAAKAKIKGLLKVWLAKGMFKEVMRYHPATRKEKAHIEVGELAND